MINAGIYGPINNATHDLIKILLSHPDVEIGQLINPDANHSFLVTSIYQDLFPEAEALTFRTSVELDGLDVLFCTGSHNTIPQAAIEKLEQDPNFRLISLSPDFDDEEYSEDITTGVVYGLPEYNRKAMVRGARRASCPGAIAMALELALFPLAKNLMLNSPIHVCAVVAKDDVACAEGADNMSVGIASAVMPLSHPQAKEVETALRMIQKSFNSQINMVTISGDFARGAYITTYMDCPIDLSEIIRIYDEAYSDHNFTYRVAERPCLESVLGTNKCYLHLEKNKAGQLIITAAIDNRMKGAAGNAVHCMNLFFGLHEKTGLEF